MRKFLSLFIAIAMLVSLMPTFAFAADVAPVVIDFTKAKLPDGVDKYEGPVSGINSSEFTSIAAESSTYGDAQRTHYKTADTKIKLLTAGVSHGSWNSLPWDDANGNAKHAKWTIEFSLPNAGWYTIDFVNAVWYGAADFYIYADGQYAGVLNCYEDNSDGNSETSEIFESSDKLENAVYLTPDENGKIKMMFALKAQYSSSPGRALLNKMTLTPIGENNPYTLEDTIPETIAYDGSAEFTVSAKNSDGTVFANNGLNADKTARADVVTVSVKDGNTVSVAKIKEENGVYTYKIDAIKNGKSTLLISSDAGGKLQTKEVEITVAKATVAKSIELEFSADTVNNGGTSLPLKDYTAKETANFRIVPEYTSSKTGSRVQYKVESMSPKALLDIAPRAASNHTWLSAASRNGVDEIDAMFTIETDVLVPGWYNMSLQGGLRSAGCEMYVYVNGKYAGLYSFWHDASGWGEGELKSLNSLYLTPDENDKVRISLCVAKTHYDTPYALLYKMWLTPVAGNNVTFKKFVHNIPATLEKGESADIELYAEMSDGTYRHINGYAHDATVDSTNSIALTAKSGESVGFESTYDTLLGDGKYTGKLTANKTGKTTFTAKVLIDGTEYKEDITVTVPDNTPGEAADNIVNVYVASENGGTVTSSDITTGRINEVNLGKRITVEAQDSDSLKFSYWRNAAGKFVSSEKKYSFNANTNTSLIAVFDKASSESENTVKVIFYNENKALIASKDVEKGTTFALAKSGVATNMTGYVFREWSIADDAVIESLTRAVALYDVKNTAYGAYIFDGDDATPAYTASGKYEDTITYTAKGDNFSYWIVKDGSNRIVSYDKTISFKLWANIALEAVYADNSEAAPTIVLDEENGAYFIAYSIPAGYEKVSAGIVFSKSGTPTVNNCFSRAIAESPAATGQFTALPAEDETVARGYLMFKKDGVTRVIYAD